MKIVLPDGKTRELPEGVTGLDLATAIHTGLAKRALAAKVNGKLTDLTAALPDGATVEIVTFDTPEGKEIYWHSASHLLAQAVRQLFPGAKLAIGPAIANGFYYDFDVEKPFTPEDLAAIEARMKELAVADQPLEHYFLPKAKALAEYRTLHNPYKEELIAKLPDEAMSFYRQGEFFDLCRGPHLPRTGLLRAIKLLRLAGAYWRGDERNPMLQRIYGIVFPSEKELAEHLRLEEEAKKRDHRKLGAELDLFSFHEEGPGFPFWHDRGMTLHNLLIEYLRVRLRRRRYQEVRTPAILHESLWHRSGHWDNFKENMYFTEIDTGTFAVKPMNCPGGLLLYRSKLHSYRELPLRIAEFGLVHRHEKSGVLHGLFRVRAFTQDDAHSFVLPDQLAAEVGELIEFTLATYRDFGFTGFSMFVATRPAKAMGDDAVWERATQALTGSLDRLGLKYQLKPGEGAFYGPKIEFDVKDSLGREWQLGTIQVDFSMPERFDLEYVGEDGARHRPVMIHRAILGSLERFIGILIEHYGGAFPLWLSPLQVRIITISADQAAYAETVRAALAGRGLRVETDLRDEKLGYKIREAQLARVPVMLIVGKQETAGGLVNLRARDGKQETLPLAEAAARLAAQAVAPA